MKTPNIYASFHVPGRDGCLIRNDIGQELWVTADACGDVAIMLADFEPDSDNAEFVASTWQGRCWELEEFPEDEQESDEILDQSSRVSLDELTNDDMTHAIGADHPDESRIDLGGGMVVPLAELLEDDDVEDDSRRP